MKPRCDPDEAQDDQAERLKGVQRDLVHRVAFRAKDRHAIAGPAFQVDDDEREHRRAAFMRLYGEE